MKYKNIDNTLQLNVDKCVGCGLCAIVCPHRVFQVYEKRQPSSITRVVWNVVLVKVTVP